MAHPPTTVKGVVDAVTRRPSHRRGDRSVWRSMRGGALPELMVPRDPRDQRKRGRGRHIFANPWVRPARTGSPPTLRSSGTREAHGAAGQARRVLRPAPMPRSSRAGCLSAPARVGHGTAASTGTGYAAGMGRFPSPSVRRWSTSRFMALFNVRCSTLIPSRSQSGDGFSDLEQRHRQGISGRG